MIYVITHKDFNHKFLNPKIFTVLHVGASKTQENFLRDDVEDNISWKNSSYCELTGLYWIWKNKKENPEKITGLVHYRRYFTDVIGDLLYTYLGIEPAILSANRIKKTLEYHDIIVPKREKIYRTVKEFYGDLHDGEDMEYTREAIKSVSPEYLEAFDQTMNAHYFYYANMMICKRELLDKYCEWLFEVMFQLEEFIDLNKYEDAYQKRVFGFISERLLQVWIIQNQYRVKEYPVFNTESRRINFFQKNSMRAKKLINKLKGR